MVIPAAMVLTSISCVSADEAADIDALRGTWLCVESFKNGQRSDGDVGVRVVFREKDMTWIFPRADGDRHQARKFTIDVHADPKHLDWFAEMISPPKSTVPVFIMRSVTATLPSTLLGSLAGPYNELHDHAGTRTLYRLAARARSPIGGNRPSAR